MRTLSLLTLSIVLSVSLCARENPFEMTNLFEEETGKILESNGAPMSPDALQETQFIQQAQQEMNGATKRIDDVKTPSPSDKPVQKAYSKQEVDSLIQKTKSQTEEKTKEIIKKELSKTKSTEPEQVVFVKPRADVEEDMLSKKILPFLNLEYNNNKLIINTTHKVSKKFSIDKENKLIIDYKANENFTTKSAELNNTSFKKVVIGNHTKENFFRIAIELTEKPSKYNVEYKDNLIIISKIN
jgi:hypothetical protein